MLKVQNLILCAVHPSKYISQSVVFCCVLLQIDYTRIFRRHWGTNNSNEATLINMSKQVYQSWEYTHNWYYNSNQNENKIQVTYHMQIWWGWEGVVAVGGGYMVNLEIYRKTSNMRRTLVCNKIVDLSDVVGAAPAPTKSSFSTWHLASRDSANKAARQYENLFKFWYLMRLILETWRHAVIY